MSVSKFDDKIRETLEGHEPEVKPNWEKMRDRIAAAAVIGAIGVDAAGSKIATQLSIGAARTNRLGLLLHTLQNFHILALQNPRLKLGLAPLPRQH